MRILTMNLWHGLSPLGLIAFERLEPASRIRIREELQHQLIKQVDPDIAFFQEVNPVSRRTRELSEVLGGASTYQPDLAGIKILGFGLPFNLFSGLTMVCKPTLPLRRIGGIKLSGQGRSFVHQMASFQLNEERFALFAETSVDKLGSVLLINTHLHHGLEATDAFVETLARVAEDLKLSPAAKTEIRDRLFAGNERRRRELSVLLQEMANLKSKYTVTVLGGDFNCEADGEIGRQLHDLGFIDVWHKSHPMDPGFTFDREKNLGNHVLQDGFPQTFVVEDLSFSEKTKETLTRLIKEQERRPRRIDQLWVKSATGQIGAVEAHLVGLPGADGIAPSDHFGLVADLKIC